MNQEDTGNILVISAIIISGIMGIIINSIIVTGIIMFLSLTIFGIIRTKINKKESEHAIRD